jgi:hypothetical protein
MSSSRSSHAGTTSFIQELDALGAVLNALGPLSEEAKAFVYRTAGERLNIASLPDVRKKDSLQNPQNGAGIESGMGNNSLDGVDPKQFLRLKKPQTELQRMACLAFFLTHARETPHFKTTDLTSLNTEAAGGKFSNPTVTIRNGMNQSRFFAPAGKGGLKQITALCEDYVNALPDQEGAKAVQANNRPARRKATKKKI